MINFYSVDAIRPDANNAVYEVYTNSGGNTQMFSFTPELGEKGTVDLNYSGSDASGNGKVVRKIIPYKKSSTGVITIGTKVAAFAPTPDSGFTALDCDAVPIGDSISIIITGIANKEICHSLQYVRNNSVFTKPIQP